MKFFIELNKFRLIIVFIVCTSLIGCETINTFVKKRNLEVNTYMNKTIYLNPSEDKTVYIQVKNTSNREINGIKTKISSILKSKGYLITYYPEEANYWIQANILRIEQIKLENKDNLLHHCLEQYLDDIHHTPGLCNKENEEENNFIEKISKSFFENNNFIVVTDLQISQRTNILCSKFDRFHLNSKEKIKNVINPKSKEGKRNFYKTRIYSYANKVNLEFYEAKKEIENQISHSISEVF
uniref:TraT complement resistance protein n=1 Tax=Wigglesworthia glossinidia brevipalpis TaxID=36870 RepID=TRAT_WIGBR|nr:RecName: Full=TraT complement resistance protein; Flags: Precursor [Wigglesworthia glossinidia endosymbiont of Glossina brevipalpis]